MRIDKLLGNLGYGTRSEIKKFCKQGMILVNGAETKRSDTHVDPEKDTIYFNGKEVIYREFIYLMLNKPSGYVSATFDNFDETVLDLIDEEYLAFEPFPVGRLDKDTEGLLVLTNDGKLAHRVLSPKKHIMKKYYAQVDIDINKEHISAFEKGVDIGEGYITKTATLEVLGKEKDEEGNEFTEVYVSISEGKFHQVKRMFHAIGGEVLYLKRVSMGGLGLDPDLELGQYRELSKEEIESMEEK
ncbi:pseudouridine synthase [Peptostreptococcus equinus]|uniref:Pseudouridine synthase n=1 Tax=Peptostreptococcus equinus TaxID=3003601 RepID=A0ABY7JM01_9FIRM|nr:pseudouridine synthase [Peptostreptococcus sp. CBA3647]WAW14379.1 pseudouridine synthase [Peptostreptococcus sp. CBA3647]